MSLFPCKGFSRLCVFLVLYIILVNGFAADHRKSWTFSLLSSEISLLTELQRVSNLMAISFFMCLFLSNRHCFKPCSKDEISVDCVDDKFIIGTLL